MEYPELEGTNQNNLVQLLAIVENGLAGYVKIERCCETVEN